MNNKITGYPSIDKPWLKFYSEKDLNLTIPKYTMYQYVFIKNQNNLDSEAIRYYNKSISYKELFEKIDETAKAFLSIGVKENDTVTLLMLNQPETIYSIYALNKIGAVVCMVNVLSSPKELIHYLNESDSDYFMCLDLFYDKCFKAFKGKKCKKLIYVPLFESLGVIKKATYRLKVKMPNINNENILSWKEFIDNGRNTEIKETEYKENKCTIIGHTGGTTGIPKGVMLTDYSINSIVAQCGLKWKHEHGDSVLDLIVPFAIYGIALNIHFPLVFGLSVILVPKVNPKKMDKLIMRCKPSHVISIPGYWTQITESKILKDMSFLKYAAAGGAKTDIDLQEKLNKVFKKHNSKAKLLCGYGMSEVASMCCAQSNDHYKLGSVGIPLVTCIISAFDPDTLEEKKYNETGEICILSSGTMLGYQKNEEETKDIMRKHKDGNVWVHTGDLGYVDSDGNVFIVDRLKRIYITEQKGTACKIFPDRIEKEIRKCEAVLDCCVVCICTKGNYYLPFAHIVLKEEYKGKELEIEYELKEMCTINLPEYAQPISYSFKESLPTTPIGKVDFRELEKESSKNYKIRKR